MSTNCSPTALHYSSFAIVVADRTLCGPAYATVLRLSVCLLSVTLCIVAKRCVLEKKLLMTAYIGSRTWEIDWYQNSKWM